MNPTDIILIIAGVGYILARRWAGQLLEAKRLLIVPIILSVVGVSDLHKAHPMNSSTVGFIAIGCGLSVVIGLIRGATVHLGVRNGELWMRYRASTIALWVLNLALKLALLPIEHAVSPASSSASNQGLLLAIGLGIVGETLVVLLRASRTGTAIVWEKGKDGAPHRTLPPLNIERDW